MRLSVCFCVVLWLISAAAAQDLTFVASVDKTKLTLDDRLQLTLTVQGARDCDPPQLPAIEGFDLLFGPSVSTQTQIVNRTVTHSLALTYVLKPKAEGKHTIPAISLTHKRKTYATKPIAVEVVKAAAMGDRPDLSKLIFVELTTDKAEAFVYEQVTMSFKFCHQRELRLDGDSIRYSAPKTEGFIEEKLGEQRQSQEVRDGVIYNVIELRTALFPVAAGEITIQPARLVCDLIVPGPRRRARGPFDDPFDDFFGRNLQRYPVDRQSQPIRLKIKPLPEDGRPADFSGAVGAFDFDVSVKPTQVRVRDPITLTMTVAGQGYVDAITEPKLLDLKDLKTYEPEVASQITDRENKITGRKTFKKVVEPQSAGMKEIPKVAFSFFDPAAGKYKTLTRGPFPVSVEAGKEETPIQLIPIGGMDKQEATLLGRDILPIMTNVAALTNQADELYRNRWLLASLWLPAAFVCVSLLIERRRARLMTDVSYARRKQARKMARLRLAEARALASGPSQADFYAALARVLTEYVADHLNVPAASIAAGEVAEELKKRGVPEATVNELVQCLEACDAARFSATRKSAQEIQAALATAERVVKQLAKHLGWRHG
ncbi:MAG: hypothetical protein FJ279_10040 [Planctomycetes bacterium]|nr:hypothetical protein [Planctomycetota bacterium]